MNVNLLFQGSQALLSGMKLGFYMVFKMLGVYDAINGIEDLLMAQIFGVPVWLVSLIGGIISIAPIVIKIIKNL